MLEYLEVIDDLDEVEEALVTRRLHPASSRASSSNSNAVDTDTRV